MAMIQKIRDNSLLTLIVIGGAIFAFILTDYLSTSQGPEVDNTVGSIDGTEISISEFTSERDKLVFLTNGGQKFSEVQDFQKGQFTNQAWSSLLRDKFVLSECDDLGFVVTNGEKEDMLAGTQPSPFYVNYLFGGPQTYQQNREAIASNPENIAEYAFLAQRNRQGQIVNQVPLGVYNAEWIKAFGVKLRVQDKMSRVINSCFYTTTSLAKDLYVTSNSTKDVKVAVVNYNTVEGDQANPTEAEIQEAYETLKDQFKKKEASRKVVLARFALDASEADKQNVLQDVAGLKATLQGDTDSKLFVKNETEGAVDFNYYGNGEFPNKIAGVDTAIFKLNVGDVYGPFSNPGQTQVGVAKLLGKKMLSDSAKVTAFLLSPMPWYERIVKDPQDQLQAAEFRKAYKEGADSIADLLKANPNALAALPNKFWLDTTAVEKGGDLGWINFDTYANFGKSFNDSILMSKSGDVRIIPVNAGQNQQFLSVAYVNAYGKRSEKVQIGLIVKNVTPGDETLDEIMGKANQVAFSLKDGENIAELRDSLGYVVDSLDVTGSTYSFRGLQDSRKIVNWAFETDLNQPSNVFTTPNAYVVAMVVNENTSDYKGLDDATVQYTCEKFAREQKQQNILLQGLPQLTAANFSEFPTLVKGGLLEQANGVSLKTGIAKFSSESKLKGTIAGLDKEKVSGVIKGEFGLYFAMVTNQVMAEPTEDTDLSIEKDQLKAEAQRNGGLLIDEYFNQKSDVYDNRKILR